MRSSFTSKQSKSLLTLVCVPGLILASAGCGADTSSGPTNTAGGGTTATAGTGGTPAGTGGVTNPGAGTGGGGGSVVVGGAGGAPQGGTGGIPVGGGGGGGDTGGGGTGGATMNMGGACSTMAGTNDANLSVRRPEISTRVVATVPAGNMMRIEYDKISMKLFALAQNGNIYEVDPVGNTVTPATTGFGGGDNCRSMTFGPDGAMYVQCHNGGGTSVKIDKGTPGGGTYTWQTLVTSEGFPPSGTNFDHAFNGLAVSPDGMSLFFGSGSRTDHGEDHGGQREVPMSSGIFKISTMTPTGNVMNTDQGAGAILFADGVRNTFDLAFNDVGDLFGAENGPDMDLPDEINFIEMGKHYGFPFRMGAVDNPVRDQAYVWSDTCLPPTLQAVTLGTYEYDANFPAAPQGVTFTDPVLNHGPDSDKFRVCPDGAPMDGSDTQTPVAGITGHKSPLGLVFDTAGELCGDYYKAGFFMTYGAVEDRFLDGGRDLNLARFTKVGAAYEVAITQLVAGFEFAPIDAAIVGNKIYTIEFGNGGNITEITLPTAQ